MASRSLAHARGAGAVRVELEVELVLGLRLGEFAVALAGDADQLLRFLRVRIRRQVERPVERKDCLVVVAARQARASLGEIERRLLVDIGRLGGRDRRRRHRDRPRAWCRRGAGRLGCRRGRRCSALRLQLLALRSREWDYDRNGTVAFRLDAEGHGFVEEDVDESLNPGPLRGIEDAESRHELVRRRAAFFLHDALGGLVRRRDLEEDPDGAAAVGRHVAQVLDEHGEACTRITASLPSALTSTVSSSCAWAAARRATSAPPP